MAQPCELHFRTPFEEPLRQSTIRREEDRPTLGSFLSWAECTQCFKFLRSPSIGRWRTPTRLFGTLGLSFAGFKHHLEHSVDLDFLSWQHGLFTSTGLNTNPRYCSRGDTEATRRGAKKGNATGVFFRGQKPLMAIAAKATQGVHIQSTRKYQIQRKRAPTHDPETYHSISPDPRRYWVWSPF